MQLGLDPDEDLDLYYHAFICICIHNLDNDSRWPILHLHISLTSILVIWMRSALWLGLCFAGCSAIQAHPSTLLHGWKWLITFLHGLSLSVFGWQIPGYGKVQLPLSELNLYFFRLNLRKQCCSARHVETWLVALSNHSAISMETKTV